MSSSAKTEMQHKTKQIPSTQKYLPIAEIKDDLVVLKDGTLRQVLMVSSINFALKNEDEQQAIINGYVQFLNTLDYPIEIVIQSRNLNIDAYINKLKKLAKVQTNELLKIQTIEYTNYIQQMVELSQIMEKRFFIVVPYSPYSNKPKSFWTRLQEVLSPGSVIKLNEEKFNKFKEELIRRTSIVASGLTSIGLKVAPLDTQGLIELYYQAYNPSRGKPKILPDINQLKIEEK
ncbi:MAG: hypothetical protein V1898_03615 [Patescibacteria group bacterium]